MKSASSTFATTLPGPTAVRETVSAPLHTVTGFFFAFKYCTIFLAFQSDPRTGTAVNLLAGGCLFAAAFLYSFGDAHFSTRFLRRSLVFKWLAAFLALNAASLLWTGADSVAIAAGYWAGMTMDVLTIALLLRPPDLSAHIDALLKGFVLGALAIAAVAWLSPELPDHRIGSDDFLHPNDIGRILGLAFFIAQYLGIRNRAWRWTVFALLISLVRTISKTSIAAFLVAESLYLISDKQLSRAVKASIVAVAILAGVAFSSVISDYLSVYESQGNQAETLTGRTILWASAWGIAREKPFFGSGIYSFRALIPPFGTFQAMHAHNELIQQFFELGLAGVIVVAALYFTLYRNARRSAGPYSRMAIALVVFSIVLGFADATTFDLALPLWLFAALAIGLQLQPQAVRA